MKYPTVKLCTFLLLCWGLTACVKVSQKRTDNVTSARAAYTARFVSPLLERNPAIGSPEEQAQVSKTFEQLSQLILKDASDYRSRLKLAQLYMLEARATGEHGYYYPAALKVIDGILEEKPEADVIFGATSLKASIYLSLHEFREAKALAQQAISINGYNALIYGSLVDAHVELGEYEQAVEMADKMVGIRPDLRSYARISYLREIHGELDGAIQAMLKAVTAGYPGYEETAWTRLTLGELYEQKGDLSAARDQYKMALVERPNYPFALAALANLDIKEAKWEQAEQKLDTAISFIPEVGFYIQMLDVYAHKGDQESAQQTLKEVFDMLADDEEKGHNMGMEYARLHLEHTGDLEKALAYAEEEYQTRPQNLDTNRLMGLILYQMGDYQAAQKHVIKALRTGNQHPELLCLAGLVALQQQQPQQGKKWLRTAFSLDPYQNHSLAEAGRKALNG
ncbi:MAG: tetratricopeptide repeat protein [Bacteroidota bacterium]